MQPQIKGNFDRKHPPDLFRCASVHSLQLRLASVCQQIEEEEEEEDEEE